MANETELKDLKTLGVSLVRRGANKKTFAVTKSADVVNALKTLIEKGEITDEAALVEQCKKYGLDEKETEAIKAMMRIRDAFPNPDKLGAAMAGMLGGGKGGEPPKQEEQPPPNANEDGQQGSEQDNGSGQTQGDSPGEQGKEEDMADGVKKTADTTPPASGQENKGPDLAELQALLKSQQEAISKAEERAKASEEKVAKMQEDARVAGWVAKAEAELSTVPGKTPKELGEMLAKLEKADPALAAANFEVLKSTANTMKSAAIFQESKHVRTGATGGAWAQIVTQAEATKIEKSADSVDTDQIPMTAGLRREVEQARKIVKSLEANPELYAKYLREQGALS